LLGLTSTALYGVQEEAGYAKLGATIPNILEPAVKDFLNSLNAISLCLAAWFAMQMVLGFAYGSDFMVDIVAAAASATIIAILTVFSGR
jgi:hypothetical protein